MNDTHPTTPPTTPNRRLHPLVAAAAAAVIVASLAATAAITGLFPKASSTDAQNDHTQAATVQTQPAPEGYPSASAQSPNAATPAAPPSPYAQQQPQAAPPQGQYAEQSQVQPQAQPAYCGTCGTVEAVSAVRHEGHGTGIGAVGGAVAGGVSGNLFGGGGGRTAMTLLGALGGGLGGNAVEKHLRSSTSYSVRVRMENGKTRYFTYHEAPPFQRGQRVRIENGALVAG